MCPRLKTRHLTPGRQGATPVALNCGVSKSLQTEPAPHTDVGPVWLTLGAARSRPKGRSRFSGSEAAHSETARPHANEPGNKFKCQADSDARLSSGEREQPAIN